MPMVEFVWWPATHEFLNDIDAVIRPTVAHISSANGCLGIYHGLQEEDKAKFWMVVVWESHAHHQAMMNSADYPLMVGRLKPYFSGELKMNHVEFDKDTAGSFSAPVTTIYFVQSKAGFAAQDSLAHGLEKLSKRTSTTWGATQEDAEMSIVIEGQAVGEVNAGGSELYDGIFEELQKHANIEVLHTKLKLVFGA
ncbi:hypothetical protein HYPSUDRAFT_46424 [Hypholoma sublateritium FD-334 SS-4]|uniref:ABM domain-containing protein n=1 Tax=Hypholoma sublateritium (strain FD-334 SS-4) TaxID=945553 RepID=A0A0D2PAV7_HYPSF|nr:hypothetical protein HYPSUDRAFT_46424 [Hypholoma sublateritium FD-334 SS-4]